jgi:hypothetical protein
MNSTEFRNSDFLGIQIQIQLSSVHMVLYIYNQEIRLSSLVTKRIQFCEKLLKTVNHVLVL